MTCVLSTIKAVKRTAAAHISSVCTSDQDCNKSSRERWLILLASCPAVNAVSIVSVEIVATVVTQ